MMVTSGFKKLLAAEEDDGQRIEVEVEVDASRVDEMLDGFYSLMAQVKGLGSKTDDRSSLESSLAEAVGAEELEAASRDYLLNRLTMEAVRELGIHIVLTPRVHAEEAPSFGRDFSFTANLTPYPELSLSDTGPVRVKRPDVTIEEPDIDAQVASLAQQYAEFRGSDRAAVRIGDFALMDINMSRNGEPCRNLSGRRRIELVEGLVPEGFIEGVRGMLVGEERTFVFEVENGDAGNGVDLYEVAVRLYEVQERELPIIDDEWVSRVLPQFDGIEGFRAHLRADLELQKTKVEQQELLYRVRSALERKLIGTIPDEMYQEARESLMASTLSKIDAQGMTLEGYCREHETTEDAFNMNVFMQAAEMLRQNLALDVLARERNIAESRDEIAEAKAALPQALASLSDDEFDRRGFKATLSESIRRKKALSWLMQTAIVEC